MYKYFSDGKGTGMDKPVKIGLLGAGTVGMGVVRVLAENAHAICQKAGAPVQIKTVLVRDRHKVRPQLEAFSLTDDISDIVNDGEIDVVVELMGGLHPAREYMLQAMMAGKHVVTANKDVVAQFGKDMFEAAGKWQTEFRFEASVGGGIPIVTPLKECLTANRITEVMGIVNGTTNYMLTKMTQFGSDYAAVLKEAQEKGFAESDPSADVDGLDAARKAAILASLAFNTRVGLQDVSVEGITRLTPVDIDYAKELGYVVKLLAIARDLTGYGIDVRVHPVFLPKSHPLASVNDVFNAIFIKGNAIGEAMFYGRGAGALPTASAVIADIIAIARNLVRGETHGIGCTCFENKTFCQLDDTISAYYMRLLVADQPGVLGAIAKAFGDQEVSLQSVIQTRRVKGQAEIVVITHRVQHRKILHAEKELTNLSVVMEISNVIRVESPEEAEV